MRVTIKKPDFLSAEDWKDWQAFEETLEMRTATRESAQRLAAALDSYCVAQAMKLVQGK